MYTENEKDQEHSEPQTQQEFSQDQETQQGQANTGNESTELENADRNSHINDGYENSLKNKNERFIIFSLIAGVVIVSVLVGFAMVLFYPVQNTTPTIATAEPSADEEPVSKTESSDNDEVVIIYRGGEGTTETESAKDVTSDINDSSDNFEKPTNATKKKTAAISISPRPKENTKPKSTQSITKPTSFPRSSVSKAKTKPKKKSIQQTKRPTYEKNARVIKPNISPVTKKKIRADYAQQSRKQLYWVQVFSTGNRNKAYSIKNEFQKRGIALLVVTKNINDKIYYRLRIGPYYNKSEGDKFLQWVKKIDVYKDAYLTMNYI